MTVLERASRGLVVLSAFCVASSSAQAQADVVGAGIHHVIVVRYAAIARADTSALGRFLSDDMIWGVTANGGGELSKSQLMALAAQRQVPTPSYEVDSMRVHRIGNVVFAEYRRRDIRSEGAAADTLLLHVQEAFIKRGGRWLLVRHTQSWVQVPVLPVALDSLALDAFVGRYQIAPGYVDDVHWEGGGLVATASGQSVGARLVPVSTAAFSPDGVGALIVFERDAAGRVTGYVQGYPNGTVVRARRLP